MLNYKECVNDNQCGPGQSCTAIGTVSSKLLKLCYYHILPFLAILLHVIIYQKM